MRIIALLVSLALIGFLFYQYTSRSLRPNEELGIEEGDTIIDTIDYAKDATKGVELDMCLRACNIDFDKNLEGPQRSELMVAVMYMFTNSGWGPGPVSGNSHNLTFRKQN